MTCTGKISKKTAIPWLLVALLLVPGLSQARITKIVIDPAKSQSPTFGGLSFGTVGQYEKLRGKAYGEVDPLDARNALITDIENAPRNANGNVEYSMDIFILKPIHLGNGNHRTLLDFNNRGEMRLGRLNDAPLTNDPTTAADAGNGFIMKVGYSVVGNGWDVGATSQDDGLTISVPVAKNPIGSANPDITGPSYEYIVFDNATSTSYTLSFPAKSLDQSLATLTVRQFLNDPPVTVPSTDWEYVDENTIRLAGGTPFLQSHIYEFTYIAKNPVVSGLNYLCRKSDTSTRSSSFRSAAGHDASVSTRRERVRTGEPLE